MFVLAGELLGAVLLRTLLGSLLRAFSGFMAQLLAALVHIPLGMLGRLFLGGKALFCRLWRSLPKKQQKQLPDSQQNPG